MVSAVSDQDVQEGVKEVLRTQDSWDDDKSEETVQTVFVPGSVQHRTLWQGYPEESSEQATPVRTTDSSLRI